ncbi:hypothetical protein QFC19_004065 [Naganishia cerealis]|uniref:Uncharacterized protein n=1 Tax=Naganishia cerealis TaxID=610337 RepID=A0ACC2VYG3_9TREE|nr:hypothetical protein QFC19_004065 [Naganishia cerealis]
MSFKPSTLPQALSSSTSMLTLRRASRLSNNTLTTVSRISRPLSLTPQRRYLGMLSTLPPNATIPGDRPLCGRQGFSSSQTQVRSMSSTRSKMPDAPASNTASANPSSEQPSSSTTSTNTSRKKALSVDTINQAVLEVEYAVRGELAIKADKYTQTLDAGGSAADDLPFDRVVTANIGNPQQRGLDQQPITFWRQVIAICEYPDLMGHPLADRIFPPDVISRARELHKEIGSVGAYTHSKGVLYIRKKVAKFIEERDGAEPGSVDPEHIFLTAGASSGVAQIMKVALQRGEGVMIPIPQYPLYTATLAELSCKPLPYNLTEEARWGLSSKVLATTLEDARKANTRVKALVVINPGNPTGGCLSYDDMKKIVQLCYDNSILLCADEVYQNNIYDRKNKPFYSFRKVLMEMEDENVRNGVELVSFHSISKGVSGECGRRGGYMDLVNIEEDVVDQIYKMASINLCPPVTGQIGVDLLVDPPKPGDASYELFHEETSATHQALKDRSAYMSERFNTLPGMSCQPAEGAMYLFPQIAMPEKAIQKAKELGKPADVMYALELLDATGICAVAGSGFGQEDDTYHVRVTALCPGVEKYVKKIEDFHKKFMAKYS